MKRMILVSIVFSVLTGCGAPRSKNGSVSGTIKYQGQPVNGATLQLHPASGEDKPVLVPVNQDGTFAGVDIPPGEYKIVVQAMEIPPQAQERFNKGPMQAKGMDAAKAAEMQSKFQKSQGGMAPTIAFPQKYKAANTTDLKCTITAGKSQKLTLDLKD